MGGFAKSIPGGRRWSRTAVQPAGASPAAAPAVSYVSATRVFRASSLRTDLCGRMMRRRGGVPSTRSGRHPGHGRRTREPVRHAAASEHQTSRIVPFSSTFDTAGSGPAQPAIPPRQAPARRLTARIPAACRHSAGTRPAGEDTHNSCTSARFFHILRANRIRCDHLMNMRVASSWGQLVRGSIDGFARSRSAAAPRKRIEFAPIAGKSRTGAR